MMPALRRNQLDQAEFSNNYAPTISAENYGVVTPETIRNAFLRTENGFTALVSESFNARPSIATAGSCCLVGVIYQQTLYIANLGDSRVVLDIVALKHGVWRVKGIIQVSRSIGDVYMKHAEYNTDQIAQKFRLPESTVMPILSATPSIITHDIHPNDSFLIFASDGLWEHLSNEEVVEIVHSNPRSGIAKRLVKAALQEAARKREMRYSDLKMIDKRVQRHFHDDITVIVLFLNYDQIRRGEASENVPFQVPLCYPHRFQWRWIHTRFSKVATLSSACFPYSCLETGEPLDIEHHMLFNAIPVAQPEVIALEKAAMVPAGTAREADFGREVPAFEIDAAVVEHEFQKLYSYLFYFENTGYSAEEIDRPVPTAIFIANFDKVRFLVVDISAGPCTYGRLETEEGSVSSKTIPRLRNLMYPQGSTADKFTTHDNFVGQLAALIGIIAEHLVSPDVRSINAILYVTTYIVNFLIIDVNTIYTLLSFYS
ncbi:hypothetical protein L1987_86988 [Smallanthus sonchifolius]|uniref:Uncharacterized protein n=1 Tax=Smallanthus sonchifolius TaxID=185202 RepID=A0ACB8Y1L5_9ASTR|nr:hypothetical protein L1987_86988 [Smallanthus sonchifolius]